MRAEQRPCTLPSASPPRIARALGRRRRAGQQRPRARPPRRAAGRRCARTARRAPRWAPSSPPACRESAAAAMRDAPPPPSCRCRRRRGACGSSGAVRRHVGEDLGERARSWSSVSANGSAARRAASAGPPVRCAKPREPSTERVAPHGHGRAAARAAPRTRAARRASAASRQRLGEVDLRERVAPSGGRSRATRRAAGRKSGDVAVRRRSASATSRRIQLVDSPSVARWIGMMRRRPRPLRRPAGASRRTGVFICLRPKSNLDPAGERDAVALAERWRQPAAG